MPPRSQLVRRLRGWLAEGPPAHLKLLPLLPTFSARLIYAIRGALAMGITAAFLLAPATKDLLRGSILVPVAAVISLQLTIGASLLTAWRLVIAAAVATAYNVAYLAIFGEGAPIAVALAALALMSFVVSYLDVTPAFKRFALGAGAVVIAPSWDATRNVNHRLAVDVGLGIALGAAVGVIISAVPLPAPATATREVSSRLRLLYMACRNELAALAVTFTHESFPASVPTHTGAAAASDYADARLAGATRHKLSLFPELEEGGNATPAASSASSMSASGPSGTVPAGKTDSEITRQFSLSLAEEVCPYDVDGGVHASVAAAAAARSPLLRADIDDMHLFATQQAGLLNRAASEVPYEPLQLLAWFAPRTGHLLRKLASALCAPCRWVCCRRSRSQPTAGSPAGSDASCCCSSRSSSQVAHSQPERAMRLLTWTKAQQKLHRILQALVVAERQVPASPLHSLFLVDLRQPLCRLVLDVVRLYGVGLSWSSRIRWRCPAASGCCAGGACCLHAAARGDGSSAFDCWVPPCGYPGEAGVSLADVKQARVDVEASLTAFFDAFLRTRVRLFYSPGTPLRLSPMASRSAGPGAAPGLSGAAMLPVPASSAAAATGYSAAAVGSPSASPMSGGGPKLAAWHLADSFPITTVLFMVLRYTQVVLSTVDSTCGLTPAVSVAAAAAPPARRAVSPVPAVASTPARAAAAAAPLLSVATPAGPQHGNAAGNGRTSRLQSAVDTWLPGSSEQGAFVVRGAFSAAVAAASATGVATAAPAPAPAAAAPVQELSAAAASESSVQKPPPESCRRRCCGCMTWLFTWPIALWLWWTRYIGLRWTWRQFTRAARISIAITAAMGLGIVFQEFIFPSGSFGYWAVSLLRVINWRHSATQLPVSETPLRALPALRSCSAACAVVILASLFFWVICALALPALQPITIAFVAGGSIDSPTYTVLVQRIVGTLIGAMATLFIVQLVNANIAATGIVVTVWVGLMSYPRSKGASGYWAVVAAFTTAIIVFASVSTEGARQLLELRVLYTVLGIAVYTVVSQIVFPVSARDLAHASTLAAVTAIRTSQRDTIGQLTRFLREEAARARQRLEAEGIVGALPEAEAAFLRAHGTGLASAAASASGAAAAGGSGAGGAAGSAGAGVPTASEPDPTARLDGVTASLAALPELLIEAEAEPTLWRAPFARMRSRYSELSTQLERASRNVRTVHQALLGLRAQALVFEQRRRAAAAARAVAAAAAAAHEHAAGVGSSTFPRQAPGFSPEPTPLREEALALPIAGLRLSTSVAEGEAASSRRDHLSGALLPAAGAQSGPDITAVHAEGPSTVSIGRARASPAAYDSGNRDAADRGVLIFSSLLLQLEPLASSLDEVYRHVAVVLAPDDQLHEMVKEAAAAELEAIGQPVDEADGEGEAVPTDAVTAAAALSKPGLRGSPAAELPRTELIADGMTSGGSAYAEAVRVAAPLAVPDPEEPAAAAAGSTGGTSGDATSGDATAIWVSSVGPQPSGSNSVSQIHKRLSTLAARSAGSSRSESAATTPARGDHDDAFTGVAAASAAAHPDQAAASAPSLTGDATVRRRGVRFRRPSALLGTGVVFELPDAAAQRLRAIDSLRLSSMTLLPAAVEATANRLTAYLDSYDAFLRAYSVAIVQQSESADAHAHADNLYAAASAVAGAGAAPAPFLAAQASAVLPAAAAASPTTTSRPVVIKPPPGLAPIHSPSAGATGAVGGPSRRRAGTYVASMAGPVLIPDAPGDLLSPAASASSSSSSAAVGNGDGNGNDSGASTGAASPDDALVPASAATSPVALPRMQAAASGPSVGGSALPEIGAAAGKDDSEAGAAAAAAASHVHVRVQLAPFQDAAAAAAHHAGRSKSQHDRDHDDHAHRHHHHSHHHHERPQLAISNVDALCFSVVSFALHELVESAAEVAACARRLRHAQDDAFAKL